MALYKVKGPNGKFHEFKGPDGLPQGVAEMLAQNFFDEPAAEPAAPI
jgi:hypothetical protein